MEKRSDLKKIVFTGPECSGKTQLSKQIAEHFGLIWIEEYARQYLNNLNRLYNYSDLREIAQGQLNLEKQYSNNDFMICDTNLQVIKLWSIIKFSKCDPFILTNQDHQALYILCKPDFKWVSDPLRESPKERDQIFNLYKRDLEENKMDFMIIEGSNKKRFELINKLISDMLIN